jgi:hypothetical protein
VPLLAPRSETLEQWAKVALPHAPIEMITIGYSRASRSP